MSKKLTRLKGRLETIKPKVDLEEKYKRAVEHGSEMETLYYKEVARAEVLMEQLKKFRDAFPPNPEDEKVVDDLLSKIRTNDGPSKPIKKAK